MILARPCEDSDVPIFKELLALQKPGYEPPDFKQMAVSCVLEEDGKVRAGGFLRLTATAYLLLEPEQSKRAKLGQLLILHKELMPAAKQRQITQVEAFIPPEMKATFGRILQKLGWQEYTWPVYAIDVR